MSRGHRRFGALLLGATMVASLGGAPAASAGPLDPVVDFAAAILDPVSDPTKEFYEDFFRSGEDELVQGLREIRDAAELGETLDEVFEALFEDAN